MKCANLERVSVHMDNKKQIKVKIHLKKLQNQMTETYEEMIVDKFRSDKLADKFQELAEEFEKDDFDMRQMGLMGCIWDKSYSYKDAVCPEYVVACCNWCSGLGIWNPELRKEYERSKK